MGSRVLNTAEQKYGAPKAEMLAVVYFVEKYRSFLAGRKFVLTSGQPGSLLVEDLLHGYGSHRSLDYQVGPIPFRDSA